MSFPTSIDSFTDPSPTDPREGHAQLHADVNAAIVAIETNVPRRAVVTLTSADLLDLDETPITLIAAPGSGKWIDVHHASAALAYGTSTYSGGPPAINYDGVTAITWNGTDPLESVAGSTASTIYTAANFRVGGYLFTELGDTAVVAYADSPLAEGDSDITVILYYTVEDVPA